MEDWRNQLVVLLQHPLALSAGTSHFLLSLLMSPRLRQGKNCDTTTAGGSVAEHVDG